MVCATSFSACFFDEFNFLSNKNISKISISKDSSTVLLSKEQIKEFSKKFYEIDFISNDEKNITYEFSVEITLDRLLANKIYLYISNDFIYTSNGQRSTNQEKYFIFFLETTFEQIKFDKTKEF